MEFKEENSLYDCIKPLPIEGGFNISDHQAYIAVILELCRTNGDRTITIYELLEDQQQSIGWDDGAILAHRSKILGETLKFREYFKLKHKHRGQNLKKFGV